MKQLTQLLLIFGIGCLSLLLPLQSFSTSVNHAETTITTSKNVFSKHKEKRQLLKPLKKTIKKWFKNIITTKDKDSDDIGTWTWVSLGLTLAALFFPPLIIPVIITSIIALIQNKRRENLGSLDKAIALSLLISSVLATIIVLFVLSLFVAGGLLAVLGI